MLVDPIGHLALKFDFETEKVFGLMARRKKISFEIQTGRYGLDTM